MAVRRNASPKSTIFLAASLPSVPLLFLYKKRAVITEFFSHSMPIRKTLH